VLPVLDPIQKGLVQALGSVAIASLGGALALGTMPAASPGLLENVATIGAVLVLAYVVEAAWLVTQVEITDDHEEWLGFLTGAGLAGLVGVIVALLVAEHRAAGHDSFLDDLGVSWAAVSLAILGCVLVLQPLLADRYGDRAP
jgi:hypothetical protein